MELCQHLITKQQLKGHFLEKHESADVWSKTVWQCGQSWEEQIFSSAVQHFLCSLYLGVWLMMTQPESPKPRSQQLNFLYPHWLVTSAKSEVRRQKVKSRKCASVAEESLQPAVYTTNLVNFIRIICINTLQTCVRTYLNFHKNVTFFIADSWTVLVKFLRDELSDKLR